MPFSILEHRLMQCSFTFSPGKDRRASRKGFLRIKKRGRSISRKVCIVKLSHFRGSLQAHVLLGHGVEK